MNSNFRSWCLLSRVRVAPIRALIPLSNNLRLSACVLLGMQLFISFASFRFIFRNQNGGDQSTLYACVVISIKFSPE